MKKKTTHRTSTHIPIAVIQKRIEAVQATRKKQLITVILLAAFLLYYSLASLYASRPYAPTPYSSDVLYGGYTSTIDLAHKVSTPSDSSYSLMQAFGIDEATIQDPTKRSFSSLTESSSNPLIVWSRSANYQFSFYNTSPMSPIFIFKDPNSSTVFYGSPIPLTLNNELKNQVSFIALSSKDVPFGIMNDTGNIVTTWEASQAINECYQTPDNSLSYLHCPNSEQITTTVKADNVTFKTDAHFIRARPGDTIRYTLTINNHSNKSLTVTPEISVEDILEYSTLKDYSTGILARENQTLTWPKVTLAAGEKNTQEFYATIHNKISLTSRNTNNSRSQDCAMSLYFGKLDTIYVQCPAQKVVERAIHTHLYVSVLWFAWILFFVQAILLTRNSILLKDLLHKRHNERKRLAP